MKLYYKCTRNGDLAYSSHEGMTNSTIEALLSGLGGSSIEQITKEEFDLATISE